VQVGEKKSTAVQQEFFMDFSKAFRLNSFKKGNAGFCMLGIIF